MEDCRHVGAYLQAVINSRDAINRVLQYVRYNHEVFYEQMLDFIAKYELKNQSIKLLWKK